MTIATVVVASLLTGGCDRIKQPTAPASSSTVTLSPAASPVGAAVPDGPPTAARLLGNDHLALYGAGWRELFGIALLTEPTGGGVQSYVNTGIESPWVLVHTNSVVQLTDINTILDAYGLTGSQTLLSFRILDASGNLIQERIVDPALVLR